MHGMLRRVLERHGFTPSERVFGAYDRRYQRCWLEQDGNWCLLYATEGDMKKERGHGPDALHKLLSIA